ncbi:hypothetical protein P3L10_001358 [Capsicum annuum]
MITVMEIIYVGHTLIARFKTTSDRNARRSLEVVLSKRNSTNLVLTHELVLKVPTFVYITCPSKKENL